jgi:serine/threonine-protein kinase
VDGRDNDHWKEIDALFASALDVGPEERAALLDGAAPEPHVREAVERLLRAEESSRGLLEQRVTVSGALMDALREDLASGDRASGEPLATRVGERVGPYELLELLGHGGMATVYLARRVEGGFEQRVAVKLIRTDGGTAELIRRFESERDILSGLRHANIARLLDGGSTADGIPYLVMDLVEGIPLTDWVRKQRLDLEARLWLFLEVAAAVAYAHRNLVVHRDLKPSNLLVDDEGHPMLLDFGIAKLLDQDQGADGLTHTRARWMTPGYAAPEQIRGEGVTTATDVYQLGVLLYELLAGARPFAVEGRSTYEIEQMILTDDPPRPSARAAAADAAGLAGDLDAIVLKAMRKEPEERYASVEALTADIRRHLTAEPVEAHRGGRAYRARKFVRRNRGAVAAAVVVTVLLAAWAVTATVQGARLAVERDRAEAQSEKATRVTGFLTSLLGAVNPREAQGSEPTVREVLERGVERIGTELADQPELQAELYLTTGDVYESLGDFEAADSLLTRALDLRRALYGDGPHEEIAAAQVLLGRLRLEQGRFEEAEPLMALALDQRRALHPAGSEGIADDMVELGDAYRSLNRRGEALEVYQEALAMYEALDAPPRASVAITRNNVALVHHETGRLAVALPLYERAVAELLDTLGPRHPYTLILQHNLAGFNRTLGRYAIADSIFREVVAVEADVHGRSPDAAPALANLGITLRLRGHYDEAAGVLTESLELMEPLGPTHPAVTLRLRNLAHVRIDQGRYDEAEALLRDFGRRQVERMGPTGETSAIQDLGIVYRKSGRYAQALDATHEALRRFRDTYEAPHPAIADALAYLAQTHREAGEVEEAAGAFRDALDMVRQLDGRETDAVDLLTELATAALDSGRTDEAEAHLKEAQELIGSDLPPGTGFQKRMDLQRARLLLARGDGEAALETVRSITPWYERQFAPGHHERAAVMGVEGEILVFLGRLDEAEPLLLESDAMLAEAPASLRRASAARLEALLNASGRGG